MFNRIILTLLVIVLAGICTAISHTGSTIQEPSCDSYGLCFVKTRIPNSFNEIGFAFSAHQPKGLPEVTVSLTVELPYGFAVTSLDENASLWIAALAFPFNDIDIATPGFLETLNYTDIVFQLSKPAKNNDSLVPAGHLPKITISPNTFFINASMYHVVVRCEQCVGPDRQIPGIFTKSLVPLTHIQSDSFPIYLDNVTHFSVLPLDGKNEHTEFVFDGRKARLSNYTEMLRVAQLI